LKKINVDLAIIGGGPAGLAAAVEASKQGIDKILILERNIELGGILQQCIHDGFGLQRFQKTLSGGQYAQNFIDELKNRSVDIKLNTMVLEITKDKKIYAINPQEGLLEIQTHTIILAMGCRERSASQALIFGSRPAGVLTAGTAQRYINLEGYLPGKTAVILGSGDIGLIMARRMTLEGIKVKGVYEIMSSPGGLTRNIVQCLDDYDIPLHLSESVIAVHGKDKLTHITVAKVDENRLPIPGTEKDIACDLLVLAVGLIPENELSKRLDLLMDQKTKGPVVDSHFMTSEPGFFAAGNVMAIFDLVDYVSLSGEIAARGAAQFLNGTLTGKEKSVFVEAGNNVNFVVPQKRTLEGKLKSETFFLRVKSPQKNVSLKCYQDHQSIYSKKHQVVTPPEMLSCVIRSGQPTPLKIQVEVQ